MKMVRQAMALAGLLSLVVPAAAAGEFAIGSPGLPPSPVDAQGNLREDWGTLGLRIVEPKGAAVSTQTAEPSPLPGISRTVTTRLAAGPVEVTATAFRAPIWPDGVDVLTLRAANGGGAEAKVGLQLVLPEPVSVGERMAMLGKRVVLALPKEPLPTRKERSWGCIGGDVPMPGWAHPQGECDPAFRNIRAGMEGVPIIYYFAVPAEAKRTVVVGLCESYHAVAGRRLQYLYVEGAPLAEVDAVANWGRDQPGCLAFDARDANGDGRLQVVAAPNPQALDRNPILNVIWVFTPDTYVDTKQVLRGAMSVAAEYYVDAGGEKDQSLYEAGGLMYELTLAPGARQEMTFLVASPGASVPDPETMAWTPESLQQAAEQVWADCAAARR